MPITTITTPKDFNTKAHQETETFTVTIPSVAEKVGVETITNKIGTMKKGTQNIGVVA